MGGRPVGCRGFARQSIHRTEERTDEPPRTVEKVAVDQDAVDLLGHKPGTDHPVSVTQVRVPDELKLEPPYDPGFITDEVSKSTVWSDGVHNDNSKGSKIINARVKP